MDLRRHIREAFAPSDDDLVRRARQRDEDAFMKLFRRYEKESSRIASRILRNSQDSEDAVQQAWIKLYNELPAFRGESSFRTWASRIVFNTALNLLDSRERRFRREGGRITFDLGRNLYFIGEDQSPEDHAVAGLSRTLLLRAVGRLPEVQQSVVMSRYFDGLSVRETARRLRIPENTVKSHQHRAVAHLREELDQRGPVAARQPGDRPSLPDLIGLRIAPRSDAKDFLSDEVVVAALVALGVTRTPVRYRSVAEAVRRAVLRK